MKYFAVFFLVMVAVLSSGGMEKTLPQEKGGLPEAELINQDNKGTTTTTLIIPKAKSTSKVVEESLEETKPQMEEKQGELKEESGPGKKELTEGEKAQIEDAIDLVIACPDCGKTINVDMFEYPREVYSAMGDARLKQARFFIVQGKGNDALRIIRMAHALYTKGADQRGLDEVKKIIETLAKKP